MGNLVPGFACHFGCIAGLRPELEGATLKTWLGVHFTGG